MGSGCINLVSFIMIMFFGVLSRINHARKQISPTKKSSIYEQRRATQVPFVGHGLDQRSSRWHPRFRRIYVRDPWSDRGPLALLQVCLHETWNKASWWGTSRFLPVQNESLHESKHRRRGASRITNWEFCCKQTYQNSRLCWKASSPRLRASIAQVTRLRNSARSQHPSPTKQADQWPYPRLYIEECYPTHLA